tara:strand:+ start:295 stop:642 length:348 start_codon:yes stop_codon:yes gene_type:complete
MAALGTNGTGVPMGVPNALHKEINEDINDEKSERNLSPNIMGSVAFLLPKYISFEEITVFGVSIFKLLTEFKFIVSLDDNNIESVFELNNNLPEFRMICSSLYRGVAIGEEEYDL